MVLLGTQQLSFAWPAQPVVKNLSVALSDGDRIGVVGPNGEGKSTLLELLYGSQQGDEGEVTRSHGVRIGLLEQQDKLADKDTIERALFGDVPTYTWASNARIRNVLQELLGDISLDTQVGTLSGGQRRRVDLARVLCEDVDVLLMDEPTNHLDIEGISWLASYLKSFWPQNQGALVVITHDRWFLDEIATQVWELHSAQLSVYEGGFSAYIQQRVERARMAEVHELKRQNVLRKELNWLAHGAKARTSKPRFRIEAAQALLAEDPPVRNSIELKRLALARLGKQVFELKDVSFAYAGMPPVIEDLTWLIGPGERIGILGQNGAGKSSLLKLLEGKLKPTQGTVKIGKSVKFGILSQDLSMLAPFEAHTVRDLLSSLKTRYVVDGKEVSAEQLLERLGFTRKDFMTRIGELSGGQKRRLAIMYVILQEPNVLIMDEPGNDLDIDMLAVLEDLLDSWPGTLLLVSHDRFLLERVTDNQYALMHARLTHVPGGVDEYLSYLEEEKRAKKMAARSLPLQTQDGINLQDTSPKPSSQLSNVERREAKKRFDAITRKLDKLRVERGQKQGIMADIDPTNFQELSQAQALIDAYTLEISQLEDEWLELAEVLNLDV